MVKVSVHIYLISKKKRGIKMYIDYQILSVVEDMSANPQSKFDGMNCTQSLLAGMMIPVKSMSFCYAN